MLTVNHAFAQRWYIYMNIDIDNMSGFTDIVDMVEIERQLFLILVQKI